MDDATLRPRPGRRRLALGMAGVRSLPLPRMNAFEGLRGESQGAARAGDDNGLAAHSINVREVELEPAPRELCWQRCKVSRGFFRARSEHLLVVRRRYGTEHVQRSATEYYRMLHDCLALRQANVQRLIYVDMAMVPSAMDHFYHFYEDVETTLSARIAVKRQEGGHFDECEIWQVCIQLCEALKYLHSRKIAHNGEDDDTWCLKLSSPMLEYHPPGYGLDHAMIEDDLERMRYAPPERIMGGDGRSDHHMDAASDIWRLGCVLFEMATLQIPFGNTTRSVYHILRAITEREFSTSIAAHYSRELASTVQEDILHEAPGARPSAAQILTLATIRQRDTTQA